MMSFSIYYFCEKLLFALALALIFLLLFSFAGQPVRVLVRSQQLTTIQRQYYPWFIFLWYACRYINDMTSTKDTKL